MSVMEFFKQVAGAKDLSNNPAYVPVGRHKLALCEFYQKSVEKGPAMFAKFAVLESSTGLPAGTILGAMWPLYESAWKGEKNISRLKAFIKELSGASDADSITRFGTAMLEQNSARGVAITAVGQPPKKDGSTYVEIQWHHLDGQTPESITQVRQWLDTVAPVEARAPVATTTAPAPAAAPQGGLLPPAAPAPAAAPAAALPFPIPGR